MIAGIVTRLLAPAKPAGMFDMAGSASGFGDDLGLGAFEEHELCAAIDWLRAACRVAEGAGDPTLTEFRPAAAD